MAATLTFFSLTNLYDRMEFIDFRETPDLDETMEVSDRPDSTLSSLVFLWSLTSWDFLNFKKAYFI
jgi:hypothetical protein